MSDLSYIEEGEQGEFPSLEDLNRYLAGEMSPEEIQALESRMVDDPMFADVIEGLSQVADSKQMNQSISRIKAQSRTRLLDGIDDRVDKRELTHKRKSRVQPRNFTQQTLSIAAGIALLLVSVWLVRELSHVAHSKGETIALQQTTSEEAPIASAEKPVEDKSNVEPLAFDRADVIGKDEISDLEEMVSQPLPQASPSARSTQPVDLNLGERNEEEKPAPKPVNTAPINHNETAPPAPAPEPESVASGRAIMPAASSPSTKDESPSDPSILPPVVADTLRSEAEPYYTTEELATIQEHQFEQDDLSRNSVPLEKRRKRAKSKKARQQAIADKKSSQESDVGYSNLPRMTKEEEQKAQVGKAAVIADLLEEASRLYDNGQYETAIVKLDEVLISSPENESAQYMMGLNYLAMDDAVTAIRYFKPILNNPQSKVYHDSKWQLIQSYVSLKKIRPAKKLLESLIDSQNVYTKQAIIQLDSLNQ